MVSADRAPGSWQSEVRRAIQAELGTSDRPGGLSLGTVATLVSRYCRQGCGWPEVGREIARHLAPLPLDQLQGLVWEAARQLERDSSAVSSFERLVAERTERLLAEQPGLNPRGLTVGQVQGQTPGVWDNATIWAMVLQTLVWAIEPAEPATSALAYPHPSAAGLA